MKCGLRDVAMAGSVLALGLAVGPVLRAGSDTDTRRTKWDLAFLTFLQIVPAEEGAPPNAHPVKVDPRGLQQTLEGVLVRTPEGEEPLFEAKELAGLAGPLCEALSLAKPGEDLLLVSSNTRGAGFLTAPLTVTARIFVHGGALQVIPRETRRDFASAYRGGGIKPEFTFGSRAIPGPVTLRCPAGGTQVRTDWVSLSLAAPAAAPLPAAAPVAAPAVKDEAFYKAQEERLRNLKRMRDQDLITEAEYQAKRQEILKGL